MVLSWLNRRDKEILVKVRVYFVFPSVLPGDPYTVLEMGHNQPLVSFKSGAFLVIGVMDRSGDVKISSKKVNKTSVLKLFLNYILENKSLTQYP